MSVVRPLIRQTGPSPMFLTAVSLAVVAWSSPARGEVVTGKGTASVTQEDGPHTPATEIVKIVAGLADQVVEDESRLMMRLQFIRPDSRAVAFAVFSLAEPSGAQASYASGVEDVDLLYYELGKGSNSEQVFQGDEWSGHIDLNGELHSDQVVYVDFKVRVIDYGEDGQKGTVDDQAREILQGMVDFDVSGDLSDVEYHYQGDEAYMTGDVVVIYGDGCSWLYDDESYDDEYYDDGYDDGYYETSYDDEGCDGYTSDDSDDDSGDDGYDYGDDYDSDDSDDWEGDDWYQRDPAARARMKSMSVAGPTLTLVRRHRGPLTKMVPIFMALAVILLLRRFGGGQWKVSQTSRAWPWPSGSSPPTRRRETACRHSRPHRREARSSRLGWDRLQ